MHDTRTDRFSKVGLAREKVGLVPRQVVRHQEAAVEIARTTPAAVHDELPAALQTLDIFLRQPFAILDRLAAGAFHIIDHRCSPSLLQPEEQGERRRAADELPAVIVDCDGFIPARDGRPWIGRNDDARQE